MRKILITGGAGFIGSAIVNQLVDTHEWEITVLDSMSPQIHGNNWEHSYLYKSIENKCHFIKGDICNIETVFNAIADNEYIIHLASETGTGQSMYQINWYNKVNIMGTSNILQTISSMGKSCKVKKILLSSSRSVYGEGKYICFRCGVVYPSFRKKERLSQRDFCMYCDRCGAEIKVVPTTEDSAINPCSLYAFTKYTQEKMLQTMCPALGLEYTIFRFQNVYGVGQSLRNPYTGILSIFSSLMLENKTVDIFEDGLESRDFINVKDIASEVIKSLDVAKSNSQTINLGSGVGTSVIDLANILKRAYKSDSKIIVTGNFRIGDIAHNIADTSKAKQILGFTQTVGLLSGLNEFCHWVIGEDRDNSGYIKALNEMENAGMFFRKNNFENQ